MKIGLIREEKNPPDARVPLSPEQCASAKKNFPIDIVAQPSKIRCYSDDEYRMAGVEITEKIDDCDILLGVKEVPVGLLIPGKTYCMFSHTIKKQPYNRKLLWSILDKKIKLIDYEVLKDTHGNRVIAFGRFAGMVGAHNAIWTYGKRTGAFDLKRMKSFKDYASAKEFYKSLKLPPIKVVLTGTGRVGSGAAEVLQDLGIKKVTPGEFLSKSFKYAVFTQIDCSQYAKRKDGHPFHKRDFYRHPELFETTFAPYYRQADILIHGIFWDERAPVFFALEEMQRPEFNIKVIADITCDIAPVSSIPSTLRPSTIADPVYGFDPAKCQEIAPFQPVGVDVMAIDNLPSELPRDSSSAFGQQFLSHVLPEFFKEKSEMLEKATIAADGVLTKHFRYLEDYVESFETQSSVC